MCLRATQPPQVVRLGSRQSGLASEMIRSVESGADERMGNKEPLACVPASRTGSGSGGKEIRFYESPAFWPGNYARGRVANEM